MPGDLIWKRTRKGTKSCVECRRRKVQCIRISDNAQTCRRCEERGSECIAQIYSSRSLQTQRLPSRYRILQLESQVASLTKALNDIEKRLGYLPTKMPDPILGQNHRPDDSDDDSSVSEVLAADQPAHLHSLFQNDWLNLDIRRQSEHLHGHKTRASENLLDIARKALQELIPPKEEVLDITNSSFKWLELLHTMLPHPFTVKSQQEMLESYEKMHKPDIDAISLASWLLTVAATVQQTLQERDGVSSKLRRLQRWSGFSRAVSDTVESTILSHDRLIGTIQGLGMALHFFRLQMRQGNFQKAWIRLRHCIVIAELMGLPKAFNAAQPNRAIGGDNDETQLQAAQMWELICAADRLLGMIINLPPVTRQYKPTNDQALVIEGVVQPQLYLIRLTDIAAKIHQLDDMKMGQGLSTDFFTSAVGLARELRELMLQTPKSWWALNMNNAKPDHIVQFLHYCIVMRVHLPFCMQQDPSEEHIYSCLSCIGACESVAQRYVLLRQRIPSGFFLAPILDLQVFTATIVLLLTSRSSSTIDRIMLPTSKVNIDSVISQVIKVMGEKANDATGSDCVQNGFTTICSLNELLQDDNNPANVKELTLKVPLLGKVHIRRKTRPLESLEPNNQQPLQISPEWGMRRPSEPGIIQQHGYRSLNIGTFGGVAMQTPDEWQFDYLSWSIEKDHEDPFQDIFISENFLWDNSFENFPLINDEASSQWRFMASS